MIKYRFLRITSNQDANNDHLFPSKKSSGRTPAYHADPWFWSLAMQAEKKESNT